MHRDENPTESLEQEGLPGELFDRPPGIDVETETEGLVAPRDHSIAAGSDPAYPNTAAEYRRPESVTDRAARELSDFDDDDRDGEDADLGPAEEAAMRVAGEDEADELDPELERSQYLEGR